MVKTLSMKDRHLRSNWKLYLCFRFQRKASTGDTKGSEKFCNLCTSIKKKKEPAKASVKEFFTLKEASVKEFFNSKEASVKEFFTSNDNNW